MYESKILTTSAFARALGIPEHTLRDYTDRGLIPTQRDSAGRRVFNANDLAYARDVVERRRTARAGGKTAAA